MASRGKVKNWGQVGTLAVVLVAFVAFMSFGLVLRDYKLVNTSSGLQWVSKYPVPNVSGLSLKSERAGHMEMYVEEVQGVSGYEFRVSRHKNMWFSQTYRTTHTEKELGMLKEGKVYYDQVRGYKQNDRGRTVFGQYCNPQGITIQKGQTED